MIEINLTENDDRIGTVDGANALIYPSLDALGNPIPVRSAAQVVWMAPGESFVCFPSHVDVEAYSVSEADTSLDGDRDTEDSAPDDVPSDPDLHAMTKGQLLNIATSSGLILSDRLTKQEIIDALNASQPKD